jgi:FkbM family methyltransferase
MEQLSIADYTENGILWAYRLTLNRDPEMVEVQRARQGRLSPDSLLRKLIGSREFASQLDMPDVIQKGLVSDEVLEAAKWTFRLLLGRDVGDESALQAFVNDRRTLSELRRIVVFSDEFRILNDKTLFPLLAAEVTKEFKPFSTKLGDPGSFNDFLGNTTRCSFLPPPFAALSGGLQGPPGSADNPPMHDLAEWIGTLRAALDARDQFVVVELGAGWAPWLISGLKAAQLRGISKFHLLGIEGSHEHLQFMRQNFLDNGLDPHAHQLIYGVVGVSDGVARFPVLAKPDANYGSAADYSATASTSDMMEVPSFSLSTLLARLPQVVDLMHCDVQGAEADVMGACLSILDHRVRRVVIGTHSRKIEGQLLEHFSSIGWKLEFESVCTYRQDMSGHLGLVRDGVQIWRNPRL